MYAIANCLVDVLRGTSQNDWGDAVDNGTVAATGVPASIIVANTRVWDATTQTPRAVQRITGVMGSERDVRVNDQLRDTTHGITYAVDSVTQENAIGRTPDLSLLLSRLT